LTIIPADLKLKIKTQSDLLIPHQNPKANHFFDLTQICIRNMNTVIFSLL
jgi:hypothetical protein